MTDGSEVATAEAEGTVDEMPAPPDLTTVFEKQTQQINEAC